MRKSIILIGVMALAGIVWGLTAAGAALAAGGAPKILFVIEGSPGYDKVLLAARERAGYPLELNLLRNVDEDTLKAELRNTALAVIITHGKDLSRIEQFRDTWQAFKDRGGRIVVPNVPEDRIIANVNLGEHPDIIRYWTNGGLENMARLCGYLGKNFLQAPVETKKPLELPRTGIYHPEAGGKPFPELSSYLKWYEERGNDLNRQFVGVKFYKSALAKDETKALDAVIGSLEKRGLNVIPFYLMDANERTEKNSFAELELVKANGKPVIAAMVTFVYHGGPGPQENWVNYLVLAVETAQTPEEWQNSSFGIPPFWLHVVLGAPEMRGAVDPIVVAARQYTDTGDYYSVPLPEQADKIADRAAGWCRLKAKPAAAKKVAIVYYNYPPGKGSIGASFLNVPASVEKILAEMKARGYTVEPLAEKELLARMLAGGINVGSWAPEQLEALVRTGDVALLPAEEYRQWFDALPEIRRQELVTKWGPPPGELMVHRAGGKEYLVLPVIRLGNIVLAPQPQRTDISKVVASYHDKAVPPPHQYVAFYLWLKKRYGADALIHLGTHGTHEWLPGKEQGLGATDWPLLLAQDMPIVYPYIMDNVGEGMQAKRRGEAVLISYLTPPLVAGGLYGELSGLHADIHLYLDAAGETLKGQYRQTILDKVRELKIDRDMELDVASIDDFDKFLEKLHLKIHEIEEHRVPIGLHTLGVLPDGQELAATVKEMLGDDYKDALTAMLKDRVTGLPGLKKEELQEEKARELLQALLLDGLEPEKAQMRILGKSTAAMTAILKTAGQYYRDFNRSDETVALFAALDGRFVRPGPGGDPIRNPAAIPTGKNLISIDISAIPNPTVWAAGKKLGDQLLGDYLARNGVYPDKVAFTLWGVETMRHHGANEAQILYLLGVRPVWQKGKAGGQVIGLEVVPRHELGRPRVDVVIAASGLYRDMLPNLVHLLDRAVKLAADEKEEDNFVRRHSEELYRYLMDRGLDASEAGKLSTARVFSNQEGSYGSGLDDAVTASTTWDNEKTLADIYFNSKGYVYGADYWGSARVDLFKEVLKGTKAVQLSRSSNLYGLLTGDDPYQYLGGLGMAVRTLDGKTPELWIANLRNPSGPRMETAGSFLRTEVRGRYWNPKWIDGVMKEGYAGGREIAKTIENLWGWDVMDPQMVDDDMWNEFKQIYVDDKYQKGLKEWFAANNPDAYQSVVGRMLEVIRKGYWNASQETVDQLIGEYRESLAKYGNSGAAHIGTREMSAFVSLRLQPGTENTARRQAMPNAPAAASPQLRDATGLTQAKAFELTPAEREKTLKIVDDGYLRKIIVFSCLLIALLAVVLAAGYWLTRRKKYDKGRRGEISG